MFRTHYLILQPLSVTAQYAQYKSYAVTNM